ncbi:MAG: glycosyltransferase family 2 protein [Victivallales bacterium]|jgi:glycosyltransferase involved in cell wall biosynthesis
MLNEPGISFIIPAYNEENSIVNTLSRLNAELSKLTVSYEIILVNDGSSDKTKEIAANIAGVKVISHPINIGYGNALKTGIRNARYEWIGMIDADGSYPIEDLHLLFDEMKKGFDVVIGARKNTGMFDNPLKKIFRWGFKSALKVFVNSKIEDPNSGFRMFRKEIIVELLPFLCGTFSFTTSMTILASGKDCFIKYIPIEYSQRTGKSKVRHIRDSIRTIQYIFQGITFFNPIKFFILLSIAMIAIVCIPAMFLALFNMHTLSLYYMIFGTSVALMIGMGVLGDIIRISANKRGH